MSDMFFVLASQAAPVSLTGFPQSTTGYANSILACPHTTPNTTRYHNGVGVYLNVGDTVYTNSGGTTTFNGNLDWFKTPGDPWAVQISSAGLVTSRQVCL